MSPRITSLAANSTVTTSTATSPRWGQQAVYVPSLRSVYFVGGAVTSNSSTISSDVVVLDLTEDDPAFTLGPTTSLGAVAFHTLAITDPTSSAAEQLLVIGGMTSSCATNPVVYSLDVGNADLEWEGDNVAIVRRRALGSAWMSIEGEDQGQVVVVGGMADGYVCASGTFAFPAYDILTMPMSDSSFDSTLSIPSAAATDPTLAVADFSLTKLANNTLILAGGHSVQGDLMSFDTIGMFTTADGWMTMSTSGDVPASRVGHSMVPHPTLDLLLMYGGSSDVDGDVTPVSELSLLNTTSWEWTIPTALQPPSSFAARAWHSSVMVPSGVMVSAFGMGADSTVLGDRAYLDARSSDPTTWSWTTTWNSTWAPAALSSTASTTKATEIKSIVPSVLVFALILVPLGIWFARRHIKQQRRRQLARHFEMHDEDENAGRSGTGGNGSGASRSHGSTFGHLSNPLSQFVAAVSRRRSSSFSSSNFGQFKPFGGVRMEGDASEKRSGFIGSMRDAFDDLRSHMHSGAMRGNHSREMRQVGGTGTAGGDKTQWEEIDFGLGKVDEGRRASNAGGGGGGGKHVTFSQDRSRSSTPAPATPRMVPVGAMRTGNRPSVPSLVVVPPTQDDHRHPVVPSPTRNSLISISPSDSPVRELNYPVLKPHASPTLADRDGWDQLADSLASKPVFKTQDPFADPSDENAGNYRRASSAGVPILPALDFGPGHGRRMPGTAPVGRADSLRGGLAATGWNRNDTSAIRRLSEGGLGGQSGFMSSDSIRSVSQPTSQGRDLTSGQNATFGDKLSNIVRSVSGSGSSPGHVSNLTPAPPSIALGRELNRLSNPPLFPPPSSPLPSATMSDFAPASAPQLNHASSTGTARELTMAKRGSGDSALRVVNNTPDLETGIAPASPWGGSSLGRAL